MSNVEQMQCPRCGGVGSIELPAMGRGGMGTGKLYRIPCPHCCNGGGKQRGRPEALRRVARFGISAAQRN
jgi:hypothetical protein